MNDRGWARTDFDIVYARFLAWADHSVPGTFEQVDAFADEFDVDDDTLGQILESAEQAGLIDVYRPSGGVTSSGDFLPPRGGVRSFSANLTRRGQAAVVNMRERQASRTERQRACRDALVYWLDQLGGSSNWAQIKDFYLAPPSMFFFDRFDNAEVGRALNYLREIELVRLDEGAAELGALQATLTSSTGDECAVEYDSDVRAYLAAKSAGGSQTTIIHGNVFGPVATAGGDVDQVAVVLQQRLLTIVHNHAEAVRSLAVSMDADEREELSAMSRPSRKRFGRPIRASDASSRSVTRPRRSPPDSATPASMGPSVH
jgi:hypothetical protein